MRTIVTTFSLFIVGLQLVSCGSNQVDTWAVYTSGEGGFSVEMPAKPQKSEKIEVTAFGKQKVNFITWKPSSFSIDKFKLFEVSYTNCPAGVIGDSAKTKFFLDSSIKLRANDFTERGIAVQEVDINGYPGRAFIYEVAGENTVIVKQCLTNNRRYDLVVIAKSGQGTNPEIARFFDSFQALK
ncbi:MAG: hypothetical protein H7257_08085 [Taibaiella sp.]|nr:hypothetical protein [Taibaiella sp.]